MVRGRGCWSCCANVWIVLMEIAALGIKMWTRTQISKDVIVLDSVLRGRWYAVRELSWKRKHVLGYGEPKYHHRTFTLISKYITQEKTDDIKWYWISSMPKPRSHCIIIWWLFATQVSHFDVIVPQQTLLSLQKDLAMLNISLPQQHSTLHTRVPSLCQPSRMHQLPLLSRTT